MAYDSLFSKTPATFCDQYAFTMGAADFKAGEIERIGSSQVFFRDLINNGFKGPEGQNLKIPYLVVAGLGPFFEWFDNWKFTDKDAAYYATILGSDGERVFSDAYLDYLKKTPLKIDIDAMPEGELAFPDEPIVRLTGPHYQVQMMEAALLNFVTAHTGWATIASQFWLASQRACETGGMEKAALFEFGARRTPEWGGLGSARSAYLAGWNGTSNMYAGQVYGIPTVGTMAHSFVMVRDSELEAFSTWAKNMPNLAIFLVDTEETLKGIDNAITTCKELGIKLKGVRLDSGDVDYLSRIAREKLDAAGYHDATVMASDSLSIPVLHQVYQVKKTPLGSFGIGGNYVRRVQDSSVLSAVMKAAKVCDRELMKFSNSPDKSTLPGIQDVVRYIESTPQGQKFAGDTIVPYGADLGKENLEQGIISIPRKNPNGVKYFPEGTEFYRPIIPIIRNGRHLLPEFQAQDAATALNRARERYFRSMEMLDDAHKQIVSPRLYVAGIEESLYDGQARMVRDNIIKQRKAAGAKLEI